MSARCLVTGASGFVGRSLVRRLPDQGIEPLAAVRRLADAPSVTAVETGDIALFDDWPRVLAGCDTVVHLAARVHVMRETAQDPLHAFRQVNVDATRRLAEAAAAAGVRRFVYLSSVKVNGETTTERPFRATDPAAPADAYAISKWEAEQRLNALAGKTAMEVVIVRPPLVYGAGVGGNFARLVGLVRRRLPLPLRSLHNRRSLLGLDNLVDFLILCLRHPAAAGRTLLIADERDWSTPALIAEIAAALDLRDPCFAFPPRLLRTLARLVGRQAEVARLCDSLQLDSSPARDLLGWRPARPSAHGIREAARQCAAAARG